MSGANKNVIIYKLDIQFEIVVLILTKFTSFKFLKWIRLHDKVQTRNTSFVCIRIHLIQLLSIDYALFT